MSLSIKCRYTLLFKQSMHSLGITWISLPTKSIALPVDKNVSLAYGYWCVFQQPPIHAVLWLKCFDWIIIRIIVRLFNPLSARHNYRFLNKTPTISPFEIGIWGGWVFTSDSVPDSASHSRKRKRKETETETDFYVTSQVIFSNWSKIFFWKEGCLSFDNSPDTL